MHPLLERHGVASAAQLRPCRNTLPSLLRDGTLVRPLPGVYAVAARRHETAVRLRGACLWAPRGVLVGAAARAVVDPTVVPATIDVALRGGSRKAPGLLLHRIEVPEVVDRQGLRFALPAWNALWLAAADGGEAIDDFLRRGGTRDQLAEQMAHFEGMHGSRVRRRLLEETSEDSWSAGERRLHALLRDMGVTGWRANIRVTSRTTGASMVVDVVFKRERLVLEFDGWQFHSSRSAFETDRARQAELVADGWAVLRFTWRQVEEQPDWVRAMIRRALSVAGT